MVVPPMARLCFPVFSRKTRSPTPTTTPCRHHWKSASRMDCRRNLPIPGASRSILASSFEGELNPLDFRSTYSLSQFDARHRVVLSYVWQLPIPKYYGSSRADFVSGWDISGIYTYQSGFPIRITSSSDNELMYSAFFEYPGEPDQIAPFQTMAMPVQIPNGTDATGSISRAFSEDTTFGRIGNARPDLSAADRRSTTSTSRCTRFLPIGERQTLRISHRNLQPFQSHAVQQPRRKYHRRL